MCVCVCVCVCVKCVYVYDYACMCHLDVGPCRGQKTALMEPEMQAIVSLTWVLGSGPLEEEQALLIIDPSCQTLDFGFGCFICML